MKRVSASKERRMTRAEFLEVVTGYVKDDPESAPYIAQASSRGVSIALREHQERAADMEVALASALMKRDKAHYGEVIKQKLDKWKDRTSLRWDWWKP